MSTSTEETAEAPVPAAAPPEQGDTLGTMVSAYLAKIRGGDVGSLPAVLGLVALVIVFSALRPDTFTTSLNFANLINQSAGVMVLAMGLVFVLLLGEIDLSAGTTAGTAAAALCIVNDQPPLGLVPVDPGRTRDRCGHRHRPRHPGREGRHPVVHRHPGRVPGTPGRDAQDDRRGRHDRRSTTT